jgi:hypothetical protein
MALDLWDILYKINVHTEIYSVRGKGIWSEINLVQRESIYIYIYIYICIYICIYIYNLICCMKVSKLYARTMQIRATGK